MRHTQYQQWLKSLNNQTLVCIQQPISDEEESLYRFDGKWRYSIVKVLEPGIVLKSHSGLINYLKYSPATGELLEQISNQPVTNQYLVPAFNDMELDSPDVISNVSIYPLELELVA